MGSDSSSLSGHGECDEAYPGESFDRILFGTPRCVGVYEERDGKSQLIIFDPDVEEFWREYLANIVIEATRRGDSPMADWATERLQESHNEEIVWHRDKGWLV